MISLSPFAVSTWRGPMAFSLFGDPIGQTFDKIAL
jgi:hypothetical protein